MNLIKQKHFLQSTFFSFLILLFLFNKLFADEHKNLLWKNSAGNYYSERFFSGEQINKDNINNLTKLWTFNSGSTAKLQTVQAPPIFIGDQLLSVSKKYKVVLTVHDELVMVCKEEETKECVAYVEQCMTTAPAWCSNLPLACEIGVGDNYMDAK